MDGRGVIEKPSLHMIRQVEAAARIILKAPSASFKKSTSGDWVLRMKALYE